MENSTQSQRSWEVVDTETLSQYGLLKMAQDDKLFPIAIVGMGCRMPGVETLPEYRNVLLEELSTYTEIPADRWSKEEWYSGDGPAKPGFTNSHTAGFIPYLWSFDNGFFNTSPKEALYMDPQQYHVLEVTQEALDDAGITRETLPKNTAVYMSMKMGEQTMVCAENKNILNPYVLTGGAHTVTANRVNFFYDINGPSMGVEASCSASLHGVHFGVTSLWNKECDAVIAGGVSHVLSPHFHMSQCHLELLSQKGNAAPFDASADGRVRAEGCGVVILKPLADALRDGDHVHCVIKATTLGYQGHNLGVNVQKTESMVNAMNTLYDTYDISPENVDYIEAHATGIPEEDRMEAEAIGKVFGERETPIRVGSCKANVGHAESASGMAQIIKAATMLGNREYFPQCNFKEINPAIKAEDWNLQVQQKHEKYEDTKNMMVGINSYSFSGQIVHMLLEEYRNKEKQIEASDLAGWKFGVSGNKGRLIPIVLSAKNKAALKDTVRRWFEYTNEEEDAQVVASWLATKRNHYVNRLVILANSSDDFKSKLQDYLDGVPNEDVVEGTAPPTFQQPKVCFVYPGQGQQWWDMGRALYATEPLYRDIVHRADAIWKRESGYSFLEKNKIFVADTIGATPADIDEIIVCQPAIVSHQIGLTVLLKHWGIQPDIILGHSLGEVAAAHAVGGMTLDECITSIYHRASTQSKLSGTGSMAAARMGPEEAEKFCEAYDDVHVACYNSTDNVTISGGKATILKLQDEYPKKFKVIKVQAAFHTKFMRPVRQEFFDRMAGKFEHKLADGNPQMYSTVKQDACNGPFNPEYWWTNIEAPVYFVQANKAIFRDVGNDVIFVEIGSSATLLSSIRQTAKKLGNSPAGYVACGARGKDDSAAALKGLAQLYFMGFDINWTNVTRDCAQYVQLPTYPFQRNQLRIESEPFTDRRLGREDKSYKGRLGEIDVHMHPFLEDYVINGKTLFPSSGLIEYMTELTDQSEPCLTDIKIYNNPEVFTEKAWLDYDRLYIEADEDDKMVSLRTWKSWNISSKQEDRVYASCLRNDMLTIPSQAPLDIDSIQNRCSISKQNPEIYSQLNQNGLQYGDSFKSVQQVWIGDGEAIGLLLPETNRHERIKTITLDAAFQTAHMAFVRSNGAYLVDRIDSLKLFESALPLDQSFYVYTKLTDWIPSAFSADIYITDVMGNVLTVIHGCHFKRIDPLTKESQDSDVSSYMYIQSEQGISRLHTTDNRNMKSWKRHTDNNVTALVDQAIKPDEVRISAKSFSKLGGIIQCSGEVVEVGSSISKVKIGSKVICPYLKTIKSDVICKEKCLIMAADQLSWETCSSLGLTYGLAAHIISDLVQLKKGESIYITEGATLLGEALIWMASLVGGKILTHNAGRNIQDLVHEVDLSVIDIKEQLMHLTGNRGIDVILAHSADGAFDELLDSTSEDSRLCLLGIDKDEHVNVTTADHISMYCFNAEDLLQRRPDIMRNNTYKVQALMTDGKLPSLALSALDIEEKMPSQSARDVLTFQIPENFRPKNLSPSEISLDGDVTYLVTGGYSGISLEIARWLASRGAKHISLVSNKGRTRYYERYAIQNLQTSGAMVYEIRADISQEQGIDSLFQQLVDIKAPPVQGIFHAENTPADLLRKAAEKQGATLKQFVTLSTADLNKSTLTEDACASDHQIQLGPVYGAEFNQPDQEKEEVLIRNGARPLPIDMYLKAIEMVLQQENIVTAVTIIDQDWQQALEKNPDIYKNIKTLVPGHVPTAEEIQQKRLEDARAQLLGYLSEEMGLPREKFLEERPLTHYGVELLIGRNIINWLKQNLNLTLTLKEIESGITLGSLIGQIKESLPAH